MYKPSIFVHVVFFRSVGLSLAIRSVARRSLWFGSASAHAHKSRGWSRALQEAALGLASVPSAAHLASGDGDEFAMAGQECAMAGKLHAVAAVVAVYSFFAQVLKGIHTAAAVLDQPAEQIGVEAGGDDEGAAAAAAVAADDHAQAAVYLVHEAVHRHSLGLVGSHICLGHDQARAFVAAEPLVRADAAMLARGPDLGS